MTLKDFSVFINQFETAVKKPEKYLSIQEDEAEQIKLLTKSLYGFAKAKESLPKRSDALQELVITNLDEEQIWQQVELQNNSIYNNLVNNVAQLLSKKEKLKFPLKRKTAEKLVNGNKKVESQIRSNKEIENGFHSDESSTAESDKNEAENKKVSSKQHGKSIVDDKFFKLHEMEEFLEEMEKKNGDQNDEDLNYFFDESFESNNLEDAENHPRYSDFFDQPEDETKTKKKKRKFSDSVNETKGKKVKFALDDANESVESYNSDESNFHADSKGESYYENEFEGEEMENSEKCEDDSEDEKDDDAPDRTEPLSTFEARQERLKLRINNLEESALKEKPWQMKGEITASSRPQNSLLQEYVEFDVATRPAPVLTEKSTMKLEDIIIQRIKDKAWDDVVRKIKPIESEMEYKKKLVLDQEKSKLSLAEIYEKDYLKQVESKTTEGTMTDKPEVEPPEHQEIKQLMNTLFTKLDALSNFHFTPQPVSAEVKIVSNLPAITMEEVAPVATSEAALLAPEEVKAKLKGELMGKSERSATDKKRERRQKKLKQKLKFKKLEDQAKLKLEDVKLKNVQNKKLSNNLLQKITKSSNVTSAKENGDKYVRSSSAFFSKLQDKTSGKLNRTKLDFNKSKSNKKLNKKKIK